MAEIKQKLTKEDIQAIALEVHNISQKQTNNASAHAKNNASGEKLTGQKIGAQEHTKKPLKIKSIGQWLIILVWAITFLVVVLKLVPYL